MNKRIRKIIYNAVKGIRKPSKHDIKVFDTWYKEQFGEIPALTGESK